ncbi:MAG TPA: helix-turn-helix domain-containing protein [Patescibacteria group bacterium]|nr:helix-turn-helix domain-containing protein [Patescibacteria group bacterium]
MSIFCFKKINPPDKKIFALKKNREEKNLSIADMERLTHIPRKYISAIEDFRANDLPSAKAFRQAYIREYAKALEINYNVLKKNLESRQVPEKKSQSIRFRLPSLSLYFLRRNLGFVFLILIFGAYLSWQVKGIVEPPKLMIFSPLEGFISHDQNILIAGEATKESSLTINGQDIMINEQGRFESLVDLAKGVNTITISAIKKHGKSTTLVRHVIRQEKTAQVSKK